MKKLLSRSDLPQRWPIMFEEVLSANVSRSLLRLTIKLIFKTWLAPINVIKFKISTATLKQMVFANFVSGNFRNF